MPEQHVEKCQLFALAAEQLPKGLKTAFVLQGADLIIRKVLGACTGILMGILVCAGSTAILLCLRCLLPPSLLTRLFTSWTCIWAHAKPSLSKKLAF